MFCFVCFKKVRHWKWYCEHLEPQKQCLWWQLWCGVLMHMCYGEMNSFSSISQIEVSNILHISWAASDSWTAQHDSLRKRGEILHLWLFDPVQCWERNKTFLSALLCHLFKWACISFSSEHLNNSKLHLCSWSIKSGLILLS